MTTSQPPDHVMNIYNFISTIIRLTATNLRRMGDQCSLTSHNLHMILISIPLCPVINVDGFISTSIQDFRTKYNILTLQAMIASPELSHRKKVTGFIYPHSKALYPLSESYNKIKLAGLSTYMRYCYPTGDDNIFSSATCNAPKFIAA